MNLTTVLNQVLVAAAEDGVGKAGADLFWTSGAGKLIGALLGAAGVVVVLISAFKGFSFITQGKPGMAMKPAVARSAKPRSNLNTPPWSGCRSSVLPSPWSG